MLRIISIQCYCVRIKCLAKSLQIGRRDAFSIERPVVHEAEKKMHNPGGLRWPEPHMRLAGGAKRCLAG